MQSRRVGSQMATDKKVSCFSNLRFSFLWMDIKYFGGEYKTSYLTNAFEKAENMLKYALFYAFLSSFRLLT